MRFTQLAISGYQQILDYAASHPHHARQLEAEVIQAATRGRVYHGVTMTGDRQRGHHRPAAEAAEDARPSHRAAADPVDIKELGRYQVGIKVSELILQCLSRCARVDIKVGARVDIKEGVRVDIKVL